MIIGTPREIKDAEHRVSLVPAGSLDLRRAGFPRGRGVLEWRMR